MYVGIVLNKFQIS